MGTFLQTGIIYKFSFSTSVEELKGVSLYEFRNKVAKTVVDNPEDFTCEIEGGNFCRWNWKMESMRAHLIPFLIRYYEDFYQRDSKDFSVHCKPVISFLNTESSDLISRAEEECFEAFYPAHDWFRMATVSDVQVRVNVGMVSLSSEGKVMFEEMQQHLSFFEKALRVVYGDNPFGKCLTVDVG